MLVDEVVCARDRRWELAFEDENPVGEPPGHAAEGHAAGKARPSDGQQGGARQPFAIVVAYSHVLCLASARTRVAASTSDHCGHHPHYALCAPGKATAGAQTGPDTGGNTGQHVEQKLGHSQLHSCCYRCGTSAVDVGRLLAQRTGRRHVRQ